jgi:hypothetical protein
LAQLCDDRLKRSISGFGIRAHCLELLERLFHGRQQRTKTYAPVICPIELTVSVGEPLQQHAAGRSPPGSEQGLRHLEIQAALAWFELVGAPLRK